MTDLELILQIIGRYIDVNIVLSIAPFALAGTELTKRCGVMFWEVISEKKVANDGAFFRVSFKWNGTPKTISLLPIISIGWGFLASLALFSIGFSVPQVIIQGIAGGLAAVFGYAGVRSTLPQKVSK